MTLSAAEQLMIELLNRARLDPLGEAARNNIALNQGLPADTLNGASRQVLAPNALLHLAAEGHSNWMLATDTFSHTGAGGSTATQRMEAAGYVFTPPWRSGENISWRGTTGTLDLDEAIVLQHDSLFRSPGHRRNILQEDFREIGLAQVQGGFTHSNGITYTTSMVTQNFAWSGSTVFLTGVAYTDTDSDRFYSVGEGVSGTRITVGSSNTQTAAAGGYALALAGVTGLMAVRVETALSVLDLTLDLSAGNAKLDVIGETAIATSVHTVLHSGISEARLLGWADLSLTGSGASEVLTGNFGANHILGGDGNDTIFGGDFGNDFIGGGAGNDVLRGGAGSDTIYGGWGNDDIGGGGGNDLIFGAAGANIIWGGWGNDTVQGGAGADEIYGGGDGTNHLFGNDGSDFLQAGAGGDFIGGGAGNDTVRGGNGADTIYGGLGNDDLAGGAGNDVIFGSTGNNTIWGGLGNDTLHGGTGKDVMNGGPGADVFVFASAAHIGIGAARDVISSFESGVDRIDLSALNTTFNGTAGVLGGGQASFFYFAVGGLLIGDQNGNGAADWVLELAGAPGITGADLLL